MHWLLEWGEDRNRHGDHSCLVPPRVYVIALRNAESVTTPILPRRKREHREVTLLPKVTQPGGDRNMRSVDGQKWESSVDSERGKCGFQLPLPHPSWSHSVITGHQPG